MKVFLAQNSGFCFGVKRAIRMALEVAQQDRVYSLGPLIHNPQMVEDLKDHGIEIASHAGDMRSSTVIVRSHGISEMERQILEQNGNQIVDATCPYVRRTHEIVKEMCESGYPVMILGDAGHPEVIGMLSYCEGDKEVVSPDFDPAGKTWHKLCLLSQTTMQMPDFLALVGRLVPHCQQLMIFNTICLATTERQHATRKLASHADLMIVIGGRNSSNTRMLYNICTAVTQTVLIETATELSADLLNNRQIIGLTAGASTPDDQIIIVYNKIMEINGNGDRVTEINAIPIFKEESC
ncbi:MAG: 4-hydroxy-3-methylbut-2-enyl diphosphate reductase [Candidatus Cloacimonetes bacterium]|nr:4-hydroxy-3-methylbut-2-enyl diphosphate reductase [Candidatus Cloacimonadota bacterium]